MVCAICLFSWLDSSSIQLFKEGRNTKTGLKTWMTPVGSSYKADRNLQVYKMDTWLANGLRHNTKIVLLRFHVGASRPGVRTRVAMNLSSFSDHLGNNTGHIIGNTWVFRNWSKKCECHRSKWTRNFWVKLLNSFFEEFWSLMSLSQSGISSFCQKPLSCR